MDPFTDNRDFVPLLENLNYDSSDIQNIDSNFYQAFVSFKNKENSENLNKASINEANQQMNPSIPNLDHMFNLHLSDQERIE